MENALENWLREVVEQGYSDKQISDLLKDNGYNEKEINEAISYRQFVEKKNKYILKKEFSNSKEIPKEIKESYDLIEKTRNEVKKVVLGQPKVIDAFMAALLCDGHVLLEGVPGLAKTLLVKTLAEASGCSAKRIQFTVDLLPSDILGITTYTPGKGFETIKGPIFANFIIADEINRSPPKCVLGETPILIENGEIMSIEEIIEEYKGKEALRKGNEEWLIPRKKLKLMSLDLEDYKIKPEEVKYLYRQRTRNPYHNVTLKSGREIKTSTEHPFFTLRNGRIETIKASELKDGECVLIPKQLNLESDNILRYDETLVNESEEVRMEIERRKVLYDKINKLKQELNVNEIRKTLDINPNDEQLLMTFIRSKPQYLEIMSTENYFFSKSKQFGQVSFVKKPIAVTKELARLMAILIAEGSINKSYFYLTMKDQDVPIIFIQDLESIFGIRARLLYDNKRQQYRVAFRSDALAKLLSAIGFETNNKAKNKDIPSFIMKADKDNTREFLKAYYEGDGSISRDCVKVTTKSRKIANSLSYLLLRSGLVARISNELAKTRIGAYSYKRRFYNLRLYGGDLDKFYKKVGFLTHNKNNKLKNLIRNSNRNKTDLVPGMHHLLRAIRKTLGLSHKQFYEITGMHAHNLENPNNALMLSRARLSRVANSLVMENVLLDQLKTILGGEFYCDFIRKNEKIIPNSDYWLYDFSMKENHSFIAGFGGIISHNTQSALIEAMQEKQVTIAKETYPLPKPFFVMANNNPLETSGVYNLPEAQVDRFLFKVIIDYPERKEEVKIMEENITLKTFESFNVQPILSPKKILEMQRITKNVYMSDKIKDYIVRIIEKTRKKDFRRGEFIEWGGSPRASIGLFIAAKAWALINGRNYVIPQDVKDISHLVLRHRVMLNYKARAERITSDDIIDEILNIVGV